ncbi:MAG: DUF3014 domain-containing protein [Deltaproteobacteria bacterium]|nr:DUF3014 domain-containing protein [Deltaproteobacteria bacterium]MBW2421340.1 DUF3014 domain-containing protein [Deltaproteobacteria bacterium]
MDLSGIDISEPSKPRRRWPLRLLLAVLFIGIGIIGIGIGLGLHRFLPFAAPGTPEQEIVRPLPPVVPAQERTRPPAPPRAPAAPPEAAAQAPAPLAPAPPPLPLLDASDPLVRQLVGALSRRPELARWLSHEELVRRFVASVDNVAEGQSPGSHIAFMRPESRFPALAGNDRIVVGPRAGERYDSVTDVFVSLDARGAAALYQRLKPVIDEAWVELGYPDRDFDETLEAAFAELLATPILQGPVELVPLVLTYAYADPWLEELAPAQKQLLRMGPANQRRVQAKLRELAAALGMPTGSLPRASLYTPLTTAEARAEAAAP